MIKCSSPEELSIPETSVRICIEKCFKKIMIKNSEFGYEFDDEWYVYDLPA